MYLGIDVGASKTLFAVFDADGHKLDEIKIKTSQDYKQFLDDIKDELSNGLGKYSFGACCCAVPGRLNLVDGVGLGFGNLPWKNVSIKHDLEELMPEIKILVHNDAKLAGLSEAILLKDKYSKVLYLTISTGIGAGVIINGRIDPALATIEVGGMILEHDGKPQKWETFASGKAFRAKYGKLASEIDDPKIWQEYVESLVAGFENLIVAIQPDVIIVGGGIGAHFEKFEPYLIKKLNEIKDLMVPIPPIIKARRPEEAVIYGCYDYIIQNN